MMFIWMTGLSSLKPNDTISFEMNAASTPDYCLLAYTDLNSVTTTAKIVVDHAVGWNYALLTQAFIDELGTYSSDGFAVRLTDDLGDDMESNNQISEVNGNMTDDLPDGDSVRVMIYNDDAGAPDSLLKQSEPFEIDTALAWYRIPLPTEQVFDSGSVYWLSILHQDSVNVKGWPGSLNQRTYMADAWADGAADPFGSGTQDDIVLCIIAFYREWSELDTMVQNWGLDTTHYFNLFDSNGAYGSWTAMHTSRMHNARTIIGNDTTWEKFFTGIAFQIDRPYIFKWDGGSRINKLECWLEIDMTDGEITIYAPKSYTDTCTYPVVIGPTFGFENIGTVGSLGDGRGYAHYGVAPMKHIAGANETIDTVCWYGKRRKTTDGIVKVAVYDAFTDDPHYANNRIYLSDPIVTTATPEWKKVPVSIPMTEGVTYVMAYGDAGGGGGARHYYLFRTPFSSCYQSGGLLDPFAAMSRYRWIGACYAAYTVSEALAPTGRRRKIIMINE